MKTRLLYLLLFVVSNSFSQTVNDYKAVIVPLKYDFMKSGNQYLLATLTKFNLNKSGFEAFYNDQIIPREYNNRCSLLYINVVQEKSFMTTKLFITFKDCDGKIIFQSEIGKSKEKEYQVAYIEALNMAFESVFALQYKYTEPNNIEVKADENTLVFSKTASSYNDESKSIKNLDSNLLYAQPTATGFQLIDNTSKVMIKVLKTSNDSFYIATKGSIQGVLLAKDNQWYFEYYQNETLISEKVAVKF